MFLTRLVENGRDVVTSRTLFPLSNRRIVKTINGTFLVLHIGKYTEEYVPGYGFIKKSEANVVEHF